MPISLDPATPHTETTIPLPDDPISISEVNEQIKKMEPDKSCGPDGVSPGVMSLLPIHWCLTLITLFNVVFYYGSYPVSWSRAKLFTIFKKGDKYITNNYRGISIINCITKLYDMILCERLDQWFVPYREQVGRKMRMY